MTALNPATDAIPEKEIAEVQKQEEVQVCTPKKEKHESDDAKKEEVVQLSTPMQEKNVGNLKKDERSNYGNNGSASRPKNRRGRNRNNNEDSRSYNSRPSGNATLFDHIRAQMPNPPPDSPVKHDNHQGNRRNNGGRNDNRDGYTSAQQSGSSHAASDDFAQMKISDGPQDPPHNNGSTYRGRGRGGGGRGGGKQFYNNYNSVYHFPPPNGQHIQFFAPPPMLPPTGYIYPMPQHIRNPNQTSIEAGKSVLAPFTDNNYYLAVVILADKGDGLSLVQYSHCPLPHYIHTEYLQLCHV